MVTGGGHAAAWLGAGTRGPAGGRSLSGDGPEPRPTLLSQSRLSIAQGVPSASRARGRKRRRGVFELAKPKTNWQVLKDR